MDHYYSWFTHTHKYIWNASNFLLLLSNAIFHLSCVIVVFSLSHFWVFSLKHSEATFWCDKMDREKERIAKKKLTLCGILKKNERRRKVLNKFQNEKHFLANESKFIRNHWFFSAKKWKNRQNKKRRDEIASVTLRIFILFCKCLRFSRRSNNVNGMLLTCVFFSFFMAFSLLITFSLNYFCAWCIII